MREQSHLLLQVLRILLQSVTSHHVLLLSAGDCLSLIVEESVTVWVDHNLGRVIEKHSCGVIGQKVSQTVLGGIVHPFFDPNRRSFGFNLRFEADWTHGFLGFPRR